MRKNIKYYKNFALIILIIQIGSVFNVQQRLIMVKKNYRNSKIYLN